MRKLEVIKMVSLSDLPEIKQAEKIRFLENWEEYVDQFGLLGHSVDKPETWDKIKRLREDMRRLIYEVASEAYG